MKGVQHALEAWWEGARLKPEQTFSSKLRHWLFLSFTLNPPFPPFTIAAVFNLNLSSVR